MSVTINPDRLSVRKKLDAEEKYIISPIFPVGSLHMCVGDSSMGKSTLTLQTLHDWSKGQSVFGGLTSHPCEWVYISVDRSIRDTNRTLKRLGISDWDIPAYGIEELCKRDERGVLMPPDIFHLHKLFPKAKLFAIEGLQGLMPNTTRGQTQNKAELLWMIDVREQMLNLGITIWATEHIAKSTDASNKRTKRNNALGSAALIGACGTIMTIDYPEEAKKAGDCQYVEDRVVHISGHNFAPYTLDYSRDHSGRFILQSSRSGAEVLAQLTEDDVILQIDSQLSAWPFESMLNSYTIQSWAKVCKMSDSSMHRWMKSMIQGGRLEMVKRGEYRKLRAQ